ncbi:hypothetical protein BVRB_5g121350 [Beta vulgaris subsp. vulgaris]|nr:hypothetical protein BVRB_5g121350 [Beta vulgaris subsp. vulgaris]
MITASFKEGVDDSVLGMENVDHLAKKSTGKGISIREPSVVPPQIEKIGSIVGVPTDSDFCEKNYAAIDGLDKGKGKLFIACPTVEISSDDEDSGRLSSVLPSSLVDKQLEKVVPAPVQGDGDMGDHSLALVPALPPIKVFHPSHLFAEPYYDDLLCDDDFIMRDSPAGSQDGAGIDQKCSNLFFFGFHILRRLLLMKERWVLVVVVVVVVVVGGFDGGCGGFGGGQGW